MEMLEQALDSSQDKSNDSADHDDLRLTATVDTDLVCKVKQELHQLDGASMELSGTVEADLDQTDEAAALASVQQQSGTITIDPTLQYQIRADNNAGQVTYRVVQVTHDGTEATTQVMGGATAFTTGQQAVIQSPFSNGGSPTGDTGDARFAYFPTAATTGDAGTAVVTNQGQDAGVAAGALGQFYVMMSPQDVLQGQRQIAPRTSFSPKLEGGRSARDDRRRATHNEVERRRRDKINNWIVQLSKLVPDCAQEPIKQTQAVSSAP
ncbi:hypothetical protein EGW08_014667, partial [Elysia chlorotica]